MSDQSAGANPADTAGANPADDQLGEGGKRALEAERAARREAERKLKEAEGKVHQFETAEVRRKVAADKGLTPDQAKWLQGSTEEELAKAADELMGAFAPAEPLGAKTRDLPKEDLKSGSVGAEGGPDASKIADSIFGSGI